MIEINGNSKVISTIRERSDIHSSLGPFYVAQGYAIKYPDVVVRALGGLYAEYNKAFSHLVEASKEWYADYQYTTSSQGVPTNFAVQIDMVGLDDEFLGVAVGMSEEAVRTALKRKIFEMENSIAMYQLLEQLFNDGGESHFRRGWRAALEDIRRRFGRPIALLAVTDQKLREMRAGEFGKTDGDPLSDVEVYGLSGFDRLFGPDDFRRHVEENGGECEYLLFVRSSDPVAKLKKPSTQVDHPLLSDAQMRRVIAANAITFNVDDPALSMDDDCRIGDTKEYMSPMGMAFKVTGKDDLFTPAFAAHLARKEPFAAFVAGTRLSKGFRQYLESVGVDPEEVENGQQALRLKPAKGVYGCYGHVHGQLNDRGVREEFSAELKKRGPYMVQPELATPTVTDEAGRGYSFIDRNFFAMTNGEIRFLGGFRAFMPTDSPEAQNGRNHGSQQTIWAEIL